MCVFLLFVVVDFIKKYELYVILYLLEYGFEYLQVGSLKFILFSLKLNYFIKNSLLIKM